jgi:hypothetical protein
MENLSVSCTSNKPTITYIGVQDSFKWLITKQMHPFHLWTPKIKTCNHSCDKCRIKQHMQVFLSS